MPIRILLILCLLLVFLGQVTAAEKIEVYTTNYPLTYFAERIGGEHVRVVFPAPGDVDPAFWTPDQKTIREFQKADLVILNGAGYEKWTEMVSLSMLKTVNTTKAFQDDFIHTQTSVTHSHGPGGDHSHGGTAFTTWLDFSQAVQQAEAIYKALARRLPTQKNELAPNFEQLKKDLLQLDVQMLELGRKIEGLALVASHPIYQYLARRYDLNLKMVMWEPDTEPGEKEWQGLQELLEKHPAKSMIWEAEPILSSVQKLKEMNIQGLLFSPCFNRPEEGDFLSVMQQNLKNMRLALENS